MVSHDEVLCAVRALDIRMARMEQSFAMLTEAFNALTPVIGEIHKACTETGPRSELEPWMEKIATSCADTTVGVHQVADAVEEIPGRVVALLPKC